MRLRVFQTLSGEYHYLEAPELKCLIETLESYPG